LTDDLISAVYKAAGKEEPPEWHLFVRQNFSSLFDVPVTIRHPERPLGTHIFTAMRFAPGDAKVQWTEIDLEGGDRAHALDRLDIPSDARRRIAARLTSGSGLIIGDTSVDSAILPEGDDFLVWTKETPAAAKSRTARADDAEQVKTPKMTPKLKTSRPAPAIAKPRAKRETLRPDGIHLPAPPLWPLRPFFVLVASPGTFTLRRLGHFSSVAVRLDLA
jgi:hypothetical protein